jgi:CHAD domain-containing protein
MGFRFKRKEPVRLAFRRLMRKLAKEALAGLMQPRQTEAIHAVRKNIKAMRAVLQLARTSISKKKYRCQRDLLREVAAQLALIRDADVRLATLKRLRRELDQPPLPDTLDHLENHFRHLQRKERKHFTKTDAPASIKRVLRRMPARVDRLTFRAKGWEAIAPAIRSAYHRGACRLRKVLEEPSPDNLHAWRKQAKILWYQVRLLQPIFPEQMDALDQDLDTLGECLGEHHDLDLLKQFIFQWDSRHNAVPESGRLIEWIEHRQRTLRQLALPLGQRLYSEKPSAFCDRLALFWRAWRKRKALRLGGVAS